MMLFSQEKLVRIGQEYQRLFVTSYHCHERKPGHIHAELPGLAWMKSANEGSSVENEFMFAFHSVALDCGSIQAATSALMDTL
jgi:hypothetical protein